LIGASFGATVELLDFWQQQQMKLLKVGFTREHTSGAYSVIVAKPLSKQGEILYVHARQQISMQLPYQLAEPLQHLDAKTGLALLQQLHLALPVEIDEQGQKYLESFVSAARGYELTLQPVWQLSLQALIQKENKLSSPQQTILLLKVLQRHSWSEVVKLMGLSGRREAEQLLRESVAHML
jgi:tRNA(Met) cytidine acetyltransferase